ncbi:biotin/lipoyl-containing protein [Lacihabitans lacunae]|uniref:Biotin/lipoyl-containing protein n=1 Tax=Lacihabitans lacunae TaxID=1028214 RepID=A0ABV7YVK5_9BACT
MNQIKIKSGGYEFSFDTQKINEMGILKTSADSTEVLVDKRIIKGKVSVDAMVARQLLVDLNGEEFLVEIKSETDLMIETLGFNSAKANKIKVLKAPMPGLVIDVFVEEGQTVAENENVLVLEAMKMENVIKLPHEAVVKKIHVAKGQAITKGQIMIELA